jgi:hypothetical protein
LAEENCNILPDNFKEAVCIDAGRVYDSCCDRDCLEDLRCYFTPESQEIVNCATSVRVRSAEVVQVYVDVEPVNFNRGFYSCDITFFFLIEFDLFTTPHSQPHKVKGIAVYNKKVILYGSEGNVKVFSNVTTLENEADCSAPKTTNMPKCVVQCVDPIVLSARIGVLRDNFDCCCPIPKCVCDCAGGCIIPENTSGTPTIFVTLGLFSIVQLIRRVQMLIPVYDFCIPEKHCDNSCEDPCDIFKRIKFPTDDFYPPRSFEETSCGCRDCRETDN